MGAVRPRTTRAKAAAWPSASTSTPQYSVEKADVILSLDADFLCTGAARLRHARAFASRRRLEGDRAQTNRLYAVESTPTNTGTKADHRLPLRAVARSRRSRGRGGAARRRRCAAGGTLPESAQKWLGRWSQGSAGGARAQPGHRRRRQPPVVHALAHAMNDALGNVGATVVYTQTPEAHADRPAARACASWSAR